jgi:DNA primase
VLCFDADAAGQEATLRGMELAVKQGFDVRVVTLPAGEDPADAPETFTGRLPSAESYLLYRVRIALDRAYDRQEAFVRARELLAPFEDSPERQEALRLVADRLDLPRETLAGLAPAHSRSAAGSPTAVTPRLLEAGLQRERVLLAAVVRNPELLDELAALTPEHFDDPLHRRFREALVAGAPEDDELVALRAELVARADRDELDERTGRELMLRLHERRLRRELQGADLVRATELQARLTKVHSALAELV